MHPASGFTEKTYSQFQNEPSQGNITFQPQPNPSVDEQKQIAENVRRTKKLAIVEMTVSIIVVVCGIVATIMATARYPEWYMGFNIIGSEIWAPIFGIITAGLGLGALKYGNYSRVCLLVAHFVMCIISAMAFGILITFASIALPNTMYSYSAYEFILMALQTLVLIGALINFISFIVSSAFICRYWCGRKDNAGMTMVYIPTQISTAGQMQPVALPHGTQVIFVQSNNMPTSQIPV